MIRAPLALALACALPGAAPGAARADEGDVPPGRVHLSAEAERSVANDRAVAVLALTEEDDDPDRLADRVSRRMAAALERARQEPGLEVETHGIETRPVFHEGKLRRWRATQRLRLETGRLDALPALLADLQNEVPLASVGFEVSSEARQEAEQALIGEAIAAFRARADRVAEALGARGVRIHELHVDTGGVHRPMAMEARTMSAEGDVAPPLAAGTSRVTVRVRGSVQLDLP